MGVCILDWKLLLIGFALIGLSAMVQAAYNPYVNFYSYGYAGYSRPYYTQFHSVPNTPAFVGSYYYGGYYGYRGYGYSYPVTISVPTVSGNGKISKKATVLASSNKRVLGIFPSIILQKTQSAINATPPHFFDKNP